MTELVCDREFLGALVEGVERRIVVEWFRPLRDRGSWRCDWIIHRPDAGALNGSSFGEDSAQALLLAMGAVRGRIEHHYPRAYWLEAGEGLGLPGFGGG